jgi:carbamoyltransferase
VKTIKILGISAYYHDSAAALIVNGRVIAAAQEERFTREKHTAEFPVNAVKYCLEYAGLCIDELDAVVFYDKPFLKFERLLETYYAFAPKGLISFLKAMPVWLNEKLFLKKQIFNGLKETGDYTKKKLKLLFTEHHLSHAASAFYASPFKEAAILTVDGVGEWCTTSLGIGKEKEITFLKEMNFPHSVGLLYSAFTYYLGFTVNSGEYKLMGLAPYGNAGSNMTKTYVEIIRKNLVNIKDDGSIWLNQAYFKYATGLQMTHNKKWQELFGFARRNEAEELLQQHCDLAWAIQHIIEEIIIKMATTLKTLTGLENLCMAGGVALNCVANGKLQALGIFKNIFIQPAAGDAGGALGAALAAAYLYFGETRLVEAGNDQMQGTYLGPDFSDKEIEQICKNTKAVYTHYGNFDELCATTAFHIADSKVVGWFQGRMEFGPRALGNRSILADARNADMQKKLNIKIKNREGFRPFAPSVLSELAADYFDLNTSSPYMLLVAPLKEDLRNQLQQNFDQLGLWEKLYFQRSSIPAVTHLDFSARVQTVNKDTNPKYHALISAYKNLTGLGLIVNTSFNVRGEPIVCTPSDAYRCFMNTEMDYLVMGNYVFAKTAQRDAANPKWKTDFKKD